MFRIVRICLTAPPRENDCVALAKHDGCSLSNLKSASVAFCCRIAHYPAYLGYASNPLKGVKK